MKKHLSIVVILFALTACNNISIQGKDKQSIEQSEDKKQEIKTDTIRQKAVDSSIGSVDYSEAGFRLLEQEGIGDLKIGLSEDKVLALLGKPQEREKPVEWEADGLMHESWKYTSNGIELDMAYEKNSVPAINSITITAPSPYKTKENIGIGSSFDEVEKAYSKLIEKPIVSMDALVAGTIYGGLIFTFDKGQVSRIFIGSAAE